MTDKSIIRSTVAKRLPVRARWIAQETPIDWDFSRSRDNLLEPTEADLNFGPVPSDWLQLALFGVQNVAEGGGASALLGVDIQTGVVMGIDPESEEKPLFLLNSSIGRFVDTFLLFDSVLRSRHVSSTVLEERARSIDPEIFPESEWRLLVEFVVEV